MFLDRVYNVTTVSYENIVFWITKPQPASYAHAGQEGSGRLRRAQAGPGSPRQPRQPQDGSGMSAMAQQHAQYAARTAQARLRHAQYSSGTLKHAQAAQTCPGAPEGAHAQEGT
jgi:hypothetical protein